MMERRRSGWLALALQIACAKDPPAAPPQDPAVASGAEPHVATTAGPVAIVRVALRGADVASVERQLLVPIERAASSVPGVESLAGIAFPGRAQLTVTFAATTDPYAATAALREAMPLDMLPSTVAPPVIERVDRGVLPLFAMYADSATAEARGPDGVTAIERLAHALMREPGVRKVRWCGVTHDALVVDVDVDKLAAFGVGIDRLLDALDGGFTIGSRGNDVSPVAEATLDGKAQVRDVATLNKERREDTCTVTGPTRAPTLAIWADTDGIANATRVLQAAPTLRRFTADDSLAVVSTTLAPDERRAAARRWLAHDDAPAWLVQDGDEDAWLLAGPSTTLRSFDRAAAEGLHLWWPGLPVPLGVRVCGDELEIIAKAAGQVATVSFDDLLDDVAVRSPPSPAQATFDIDREAAARLGVSAQALQRIMPLLVGEELRLRDDLIVRVPATAASTLTVAAGAGAVPVTELGTLRLDAQPAFITRFDARRCIRVDLQPRRAGDRAKIEALVQQRIELPAGVSLQIAEP